MTSFVLDRLWEDRIILSGFVLLGLPSPVGDFASSCPFLAAGQEMRGWLLLREFAKPSTLTGSVFQSLNVLIEREG